MLRSIFKTQQFLVRNVQINQVTGKRFAGHSKWANIKHTKGLKDAQRASLFTKISRQIKVAIQEGGSPDPKNNLKLEHVMEQARRANMPAATVQSVIKSCQLDKKQCKSYTLEIKGPGGCVIICDVFTDNLHHLKQMMATIIKRHGCKFSDGGGKHLFEQKGIILAELPENTPKDLLEIATDHAIESGAEDVEVHEDVLEFICAPTTMKRVTKELEKLNYKIKNEDVRYIPFKATELSDVDMEVCSSLYEKLEAMQEVVNLHDNIQ